MTQPITDWDRFRQLHSELTETGPGAKRIAIDFHCHTPASDDFATGDPKAYDAIAERIALANIDAVFVTDHNTWKGIAPLTEAVKRRAPSACVYPGVELTVAVNAARIGDGVSREERKVKPYFYHILVFLPPSDQVEAQIQSLVTNDFRNSPILDLPPTERKLAQPLEEIAATVHSWKGLVLIAHFHQSKAPEKSRSHDDLFVDSLVIKDIHNCFDAIEIRTPDADRFFTGHEKGIGGDLIPERACVLGSDAHTPDDYGAELTWLLVENNSFGDIAASLRYRERVSFAPLASERDVLVDLVVEGTFIGRHHLALNAELTALIGTKGSGKSALLECIRFALGFPAGPGGEPYLNNILGPAGRVWLSAKNHTGEAFLFVRGRQDAEPRVSTLDGTSLQRNAVIPAHFNVEIRGWGEVTKLAENKAAQLQLLDDLDVERVCEATTARVTELKASLPDRLRALTAAVARLRETKEDLDELRLKKSRLDKLQVTKLVDEQDHKERRDAEVAGYRALLRELQEGERDTALVFAKSSLEQVKSFREAIALGAFSAPMASKADSAIVVARAQEQKLSQEATEALAALIGEVKSCLAELELAVAPLEERYQALFAELDLNEQGVLLARNEIVRETARLPSVTGRYETQSAEVTKLLHEYADTLDGIQAA